MSRRARTAYPARGALVRRRALVAVSLLAQHTAPPALSQKRASLIYLDPVLVDATSCGCFTHRN